MMLTTKGRYAVMALLDIASEDPKKAVKLSTISDRQGIALNYLEQIFLKLKRAGIVNSVRGPGGGYLLTADTASISIDQIIDAVEESIDMTRCAGRGKGCMPKNLKCKAHDLWEGLSNKIRGYFQDISLKNVIDGKVFDAISRS